MWAIEISAGSISCQRRVLAVEEICFMSWSFKLGVPVLVVFPGELMFFFLPGREQVAFF